LHDDLCQQLSGIEFLSQTLARQLTTSAAAEAVRAREIASMIRQAMDHARQLARGLSPMPLALVDDGLRAALGELADRTQQLFHITCRARCDAPVQMPDKSIGIHLYRIAQEAISNAIKHGGAKRVDIKLRVGSDGIVLGVSDNGVGFPPRLQKRRGMGLRVMQYRASVVGGSLTVQRRLGGGTIVECKVKMSKVGRPNNRGKKNQEQ
jgi:signal transduction histidine kinase